MERPIRQQDAVDHQQPALPVPPPGASFVLCEARRTELNEAERALLAKIRDLSRREGYCWMSIPRLAREVGVSQRYLQHMLNGRWRGGQCLRPGLVERGYLHAVRRDGKPTHHVPTDKPLVLAPPPSICSPPPTGKCSPPGVSKCSPKCIDLEKKEPPGASLAPGEQQILGYDGQPVRISLALPLHSTDRMNLIDRLYYAFAVWGRVNALWHGGRIRIIEKVMRTNQGCWLDLADSTERPFVPQRQIAAKAWYLVPEPGAPS